MLKEEVKKEINELKASNLDNKNSDTESKFKRVENNLTDEENSEIEPNLMKDDEDEKVHIRKKRSIRYPHSMRNKKEAQGEFVVMDTNLDGFNRTSNSTKHRSRNERRCEQ
ncbi:hypothetical protein JTB14_017333 [Gonioctena quinquepunctata]|nr:hypothetical protein JTB14_017333 [Gonioctena quinquepunctata]